MGRQGKPNAPDSQIPCQSESGALESLGLTPREAEVLLWVAQGKGNADIATILGCAENTVKVRLARVFEKLGFENRNAAAVRALEILSSPAKRAWLDRPVPTRAPRPGFEPEPALARGSGKGRKNREFV